MYNTKCTTWCNSQLEFVFTYDIHQCLMFISNCVYSASLPPYYFFENVGECNRKFNNMAGVTKYNTETEF